MLKMTKILLMVCLLINVVVYAQSPKETVNEFFNALNSKNAEKLGLLMLDDLKLHSLNISSETKLSTTDKQVFLSSIRNIPEEIQIEERIFDIESMENEHIATVWVSYEFFANGTFSHKGVNIFTLIKIDKSWKITSISDTRLRSKN
jgi:hypothetical protein